MQKPFTHFSIEDFVCDTSFQQYCLGNSLENQLVWQEWIAANPNKRQDVEEAKRIILILSAKQGSRLQQLKALRSGMQQRDALEQKLFQTEIDAVRVVTLTPRTNRYRWPLIGAAAVVFLCFAGYFAFYQPAAIPGFNFKSTDALTIRSAKSPRKTVILSDGTIITLAVNSTIRMSPDFVSGQRELWLNGEAFFNVKHDRAHPFVVHTAFNDIKVLGTTFNVRAYSVDKTMETALIHGSVRIDSRKFPGYYVVLKPNEKVITNNYADAPVADSGKKMFHVSALNTERTKETPAEIRWVKKRLTIENQSLENIAQQLQTWYGIDIVIADDKVKAYHYSGVFENETIVKTLEALQLSYPFNFQVTHNQIIISK
ncbi:FecR family protein [Pedobacter duraquae]|uniref:FecR family protein n=1 Tax=Pedobacter duraquae TaxID=425511 RepID=A0A4R6IIQ0_9SPHI|nr:FecR domain-containing protein [Pedobacter duraquae]TDO21862.1 FecR family protein [Pedobacter duraquae]